MLRPEALYVKVKRSCGCDSAGVWVTCSGRTATPGEDFVAATTRLAFRRGSALESLAVHILADTLPEPTEVVLVTLGPASGFYEITDPDSILDDEVICPSDTCPATPGSWQAQLQETLPWLLADLSSVTDTTVTLFSTFSTGSGSWDSDQRTLRIFGRENTAVPAGRFRQTLRVKYEHEFAHSGPGYSYSGSSGMEFTLADSVGFIRMGYGSNTSGEYWREDSCRGELVSYALQN